MGAFLVTGGAGFVGSHVVDLLVAGGHEVRVVDRLDPAAHGGKPGYLNAGAAYHWADVGDVEALRPLVRGLDGVCHQAAKVGLGVGLGDLRGYVADNDVGTAGLLTALHETGFAGRLGLASSMVVYGEGAYACEVHGSLRPGPREVAALQAGRFEPPCPACGRPLEGGEVSEDAPTDPRNVYAATKLHQEHLAAVYGRERGVAVTTLRYHNVYGPRMPRDTPYAGVASIVRSAFERGVAPRVFEDGGQRRDFVHVADVARANVLALTAPDPLPGVFNIASGTPHTVGEMASALHAAYPPGTPEPVVTGEWRLGDVRHVVASPARAADHLGFRAEVDFTDGMAQFATAPLRG